MNTRICVAVTAALLLAVAGPASGQDFGFRLEDHAGALDTKALEAALDKARAAPPPRPPD